MLSLNISFNLEIFCKISKIIVNVIKTKVMVFRLCGRLHTYEKLFYNGNELEVVNGFQYVGLLFLPKLYMYRMTDDLSKKAERMIVSVLQSLNSYGLLSSYFYMKLCSVLLYGCEIWGTKQFETVARI